MLWREGDEAMSSEYLCVVGEANSLQEGDGEPSKGK